MTTLVETYKCLDFRKVFGIRMLPSLQCNLTRSCVQLPRTWYVSLRICHFLQTRCRFWRQPSISENSGDCTHGALRTSQSQFLERTSLYLPLSSFFPETYLRYHFLLFEATRFGKRRPHKGINDSIILPIHRIDMVHSQSLHLHHCMVWAIWWEYRLTFQGAMENRKFQHDFLDEM